MKKVPVTVRICAATALVLTLFGIILRTVAMFVCYDREVGYFDATPLATLLTVLSFAAVLCPIVLTIATPKSALPDVWPRPRHDLSPLLPAVLFILSGILIIATTISDGSSSPLALAAGLLGLFSSIYYILLSRGKSTSALSVIGYLPILWGLLAVAETYTDQMTTMNSPIKLSLQFGCLGLMLMATSELRFIMRKPAPRAALCFHSLALFFCLSGSIPTLIALVAGILTRPIHGAYALALLGAGIHAAFRLVYYISVPVEAETSVSVSEAEASESTAAAEAAEAAPETVDPAPETDTDHTTGQ